MAMDRYLRRKQPMGVNEMCGCSEDAQAAEDVLKEGTVGFLSETTAEDD